MVIRLEERMAGFSEELQEVKANVEKLVTAFDMGRGGFIVLTKVGGVIVLFAGAMAWGWEHLVVPLLGKPHP